MKRRANIVIYLFLAIWLIWSFLPVFWTFLTSIKKASEAFAIPPTWIFKPTLESYDKLWVKGEFPSYLFNSVIISFSTVMVSIPIGSLAGYALSRYAKIISFVLLFVALVFRMFPRIVFIIPFYYISRLLGLYDTRLNVAHAQLARYYGIPSRGTGCNTDSKILDMQAGYEKALTLLLTALAGNDMIFYPGTIEHALTIDYRSLLIDNEMCGMVLRTIQGIEVSEETQAIDLIKEVGSTGHYLGKKHTLKHMSKELYFVQLTDRDTRDDWVSKGAKRLDEIAKDRVLEILKTHKPEPLPEHVLHEMELFVQEVETRVQKADN